VVPDRAADGLVAVGERVFASIFQR